MPPTRRSRTSAGPAAKGAQKTLAFGPNANKSISKPHTSSSSLSLKDKTNSSSSTAVVKSEEQKKKTLIKSEPRDDDDAAAAAAALDLGHVSSEAAVLKQAKVELARQERTAEELRAERVTDAQIRRYWRDREAERKAPRVHQQDLSTEEKILRLFDMSSQYGPCIGIARMKRWVRANKLGLNPPIEVLAVLLKEEGKENSKIERAYVDELMSSKFVVGEA